jgi:hypothetical protein
MPLQATSGAASYDAFGSGAAAGPTYIEDVFSTWLYTGNGSTQTITNGIDLAGKGGLVWIKNRDTAGYVHRLFDNARGNFSLSSNSTAAQVDFSGLWGGFTSSGFSIAATQATLNESNKTFASWTFREQPKFFDVVTWTGNGVDGRQIPHNLGSAPGCVIIKRTDATLGWAVYHRSLTTTYGELNSTDAFATSQLGGFNMQEVFGNSSTIILPDANNITVARFGASNASGATYVAYVFAHNAGGFGLTGTDNVISCGSYTGNGSTNGPVVTLGYEPQWLLVKKSSVSGTSWTVIDTMRGMAYTGNLNELLPNSSNAENSLGQVNGIYPTATGFSINTTQGYFNESGSIYIYIAIRRGPMKVPTTGTSVLNLSARTGNGNASAGIGAGFTDLIITKDTAGSQIWAWTDRLRGRVRELNSSTATAETPYFDDVTGFDRMDGVFLGTGAGGQVNSSGTPYINYLMRRAPSVFDEVCYTGTGSATTFSHNLAAVPELMIVKSRSVGSSWYVYTPTIGNTNTLVLNSTAAFESRNVWGSTTPTASVFSVGNDGSGTNNSGATYVAYLFATCPGVSKVGSYTGTGTTQTINCGFTSGARFVMIKRTDDVGSWYVWNSASGIVAGNDPYLLFNSASAETTNTDYIDTAATGFEITSSVPAAINGSGGTFIFLAIA